MTYPKNSKWRIKIEIEDFSVAEVTEEGVEEFTGQECPGYEELPQWVFLNLDLTFRRNKVGFCFLGVQDALQQNKSFCCVNQ